MESGKAAHNVQTSIKVMYNKNILAQISNLINDIYPLENKYGEIVYLSYFIVGL